MFVLSLPKCNSSMCSELIPGFSVLNHFKLLKTRPFTATNNHNGRTLLCPIRSCIRVVLCCPTSHGRGKHTASRMQALFHERLLADTGRKAMCFFCHCCYDGILISAFCCCCLVSSGPQILIQRSVPEQICSLAADHLQSSFHLSWFTDTWWPIHLFKQTIVQWRDGIFTMNIHVVLARLVFWKYLWKFPLSPWGHGRRGHLPMTVSSASLWPFWVRTARK